MLLKPGPMEDRLHSLFHRCAKQQLDQRTEMVNLMYGDPEVNAVAWRVVVVEQQKVLQGD